MRHFVAWALLASAFTGVLGTFFSYDENLSGALYALAGLGLYIFGIWSAVILLRGRR